MNACVVPSGGFSGTAGFSVLELEVQRGSTRTALTESRPRPVAESLLHIGDIVEWREDTEKHTRRSGRASCDMRVAQVFDPCRLLLRTIGVECGLQTPQPGSVIQR